MLSKNLKILINGLLFVLGQECVEYFVLLFSSSLACQYCSQNFHTAPEQQRYSLLAIPDHTMFPTYQYSRTLYFSLLATK